MKPTIECARNGPLLAKALTKLVRVGGETVYETKEVVALCRCGRSQNKPFCDGTHSTVGFDDSVQPGRTEDRRRDYVGARITIHDNRGLCAHAGLCTDRLGAVFRMKQEPWIDPDAASVEEIRQVVAACPSGAISYSVDGVEHRDLDDDDPRVMVVPDGPYAIKGSVELVGVEWGEGASREHYDLCRCGASKNKPFCDGSHWNTEFDENAEPSR